MSPQNSAVGSPVAKTAFAPEFGSETAQKQPLQPAFSEDLGLNKVGRAVKAGAERVSPEAAGLALIN